jgi:hypothetical protein
MKSATVFRNTLTNGIVAERRIQARASRRVGEAHA